MAALDDENFGDPEYLPVFSEKEFTPSNERIEKVAGKKTYNRYKEKQRGTNALKTTRKIFKTFKKGMNKMQSDWQTFYNGGDGNRDTRDTSKKLLKEQSDDFIRNMFQAVGKMTTDMEDGLENSQLDMEARYQRHHDVKMRALEAEVRAECADKIHITPRNRAQGQVQNLACNVHVVVNGVRSDCQGGNNLSKKELETHINRRHCN